MGIVEQTQELIEVSELVGRKVIIEQLNRDETYNGTLHSISNHGVLIRGNCDYRFFPWGNIDYIRHIIKAKDTEVNEPVTTEEKKKEDELEIVDPPDRIVDGILTSDYSCDADVDDDGEYISVYNEEKEHVIHIALYSPSHLKVYTETDMELAKRIAKELKIKKIIRNF